jgi:hypothetical protein
MEPQSTEGNIPSKSQGNLTLTFLGCATAAILLTATAYPIARVVVAWMGIH